MSSNMQYLILQFAINITAIILLYNYFDLIIL